MTAADDEIALYWSALHAPDAAALAAVQAWQRQLTRRVEWLDASWAGDELQLSDRASRCLRLRLQGRRPAGCAAWRTGPAVLLGVLRVAQLLGWSLTTEQLQPLAPTDVARLFAGRLDAAGWALWWPRVRELGLRPEAFCLAELRAHGGPPAPAPFL